MPIFCVLRCAEPGFQHVEDMLYRLSSCYGGLWLGIQQHLHSLEHMLVLP